MKKIIFTLMMVLVLSLLVPGGALAAGGDPAPVAALGGRLTYGVVTQVDVEAFSLETKGGGTFRYQVDEATRFRSPEIENPTYADLLPGTWVAVAARPVEGDLVARMVVLLPEGFDPSRRFGERARGEVQMVDLEAGRLSLVTPAGEEMVFQVDEATRFLGQAESLEEIQVGWVAAAAGHLQEDGSRLAVMVAAGEDRRLVIAAGKVVSVDLEAGRFTLLTRQDEEREIEVDGDTVFTSRENTIQGLEDLDVGMVAVVRGVPQDDGSILAKRVAAGSKEDLPDFEVKAGGRVTVVGTDFFTIQDRDGETIRFIMNEDTRIRSRGGAFQGHRDLRVGMVVLVGGEVGEDGENLARLVIVVRAGP